MKDMASLVAFSGAVLWHCSENPCSSPATCCIRRAAWLCLVPSSAFYYISVPHAVYRIGRGRHREGMEAADGWHCRREEKHCKEGAARRKRKSTACLPSAFFVSGGGKKRTFTKKSAWRNAWKGHHRGDGTAPGHSAGGKKAAANKADGGNVGRRGRLPSPWARQAVLRSSAGRGCGISLSTALTRGGVACR